MARKIDTSARDAARESLRNMFPIGSTVHTSLLYVSRSGMLRSVAVLVTDSDGSIRNVSGLVARATGNRLHKTTDGVSMGGCGMDMGFALVYSLSHSLYSDARTPENKRDGRPPFLCTGTRYATNEGDPEGTRAACPSNDHSNEGLTSVQRSELESLRTKVEDWSPADLERATYLAGRDHNYSTSRVHSDAGYALNHRWV